MSIYKTGHYFTTWRFPSAIERVATAIAFSDRGKVAWQQDDNSLWIATAAGWHLFSTSSTTDSYIPISSYAGEAIPAGKQRLVYGDFTIVGDLELIGDLVLL